MSEILTLKKLFNTRNLRQIDGQNTTFVGIDFGTNTTVVSIARCGADDEIESTGLLLTQTDADGFPMESEYFPTVIAVRENGSPLFGVGAYEKKWNSDYEFGRNLWHSFKMELGKDTGPIWLDSADERIKSPKDATRIFFRFLKRAVERAVSEVGLSDNIKYAVSIPASFESNQRKDLLEALEANGIKVDDRLFVDEPNAAFLAYLAENYIAENHIVLKEGYNPKVLVFDFGAGTCDISILEINADYNGMFVKNLSISKFAELGGNDIDRYIASNYLLPQLLTANGLKTSDFTRKQLDFIATQLYGYAERLKVKVSKDFNYLIDENDDLLRLLKNKEGARIGTPELSIRTNHELLKIDAFTLGYSEFQNAMGVFFGKKIVNGKKAFEGQKAYNSVVAALESAIEKAHVDVDEIDYVIMVGGSSKNPFVIRRIKEFFGDDKKVLLPSDMQSLVSQGAAIHSLLQNGAGIDAVRPIAGEAIIVISKQAEIPVISAGTELPCRVDLTDGLTTGSKSYRTIEIPVCVGSDKKMIANLKIKRPDGTEFPAGALISLSVEIDTNKVIHIVASYGNETWETQCENPFANTYQTNSELKVAKAQRDTYISADQNNGKASKESLKALSDAYADAGLCYQAAETLEEILATYPKGANHNLIGVLYHSAGNYGKAISHFRKALEEKPNSSIILSNLGDDLCRVGDYDGARPVLERAIELEADNPYAKIKLARLEDFEGNIEIAEKLYVQAYNILKRLWDSHKLDDCGCGWFEAAAMRTGHPAIAAEVREYLAGRGKSKGYDAGNILEANIGEV